MKATDNYQVELTEEDLQYIVDNIEIDDDDLGTVTLKQGAWELTVRAWFHEVGGSTTGGSYGYDYESVWVHDYWECPHDIDVWLIDAENEYELAPDEYKYVEGKLESKDEYY